MHTQTPGLQPEQETTLNLIERRVMLAREEISELTTRARPLADRIYGAEPEPGGKERGSVAAVQPMASSIDHAQDILSAAINDLRYQLSRLESL